MRYVTSRSVAQARAMPASGRDLEDVALPRWNESPRETLRAVREAGDESVSTRLSTAITRAVLHHRLKHGSGAMHTGVLVFAYLSLACVDAFWSFRRCARRGAV